MDKGKNIMVIDGEKYIREVDVLETLSESSPLIARYVGKPVIVRNSCEGVNIGRLVAADGTGLIISGARRLWYHRPKNDQMSWYEGVSISGLSDDSKVSETVDFKIIVENYSLTSTSEEVYADILEKAPYVG